MFQTPRDVSQRLMQTVIVCDGQLVYVENVRDWVISYRALSVNKTKTMDVSVKANYDKLDYTSLCVGYIYDKNRAAAHYLVRSTVRQYVGGVSSRNVFSQSGASWSHLYATKAFEDCVLGNHASLSECIAEVRETGGSIPFNRHYALRNESGNILVLCRDQIIGTVKNERISLFESNYKSVLYNDLCRVVGPEKVD